MKNVWTARKYSLLLTKYWHHEDFIWQWWCAGDCCQIWLLMGENDLVFCFWLLDRHCVPNISMPHGWHWKHTHTHTHTILCLYQKLESKSLDNNSFFFNQHFNFIRVFIKNKKYYFGPWVNKRSCVNIQMWWMNSY